MQVLDQGWKTERTDGSGQGLQCVFAQVQAAQAGQCPDRFGQFRKFVCRHVL